MKKRILKAVIVFMILFTGTAMILMLDNICLQTTGYGGKLLFDVEKQGLFE